MSQEKTYRIFEIGTRGDNIKPYIVPEEYTLSNGTKISVVTVGEKGRGRSLGIIPINATPEQKIESVKIGQTKSGKPRFYVADKSTQNDEIIVVFKIKGGFRGHNSYCGDRYQDGWQFSRNFDITLGLSSAYSPTFKTREEALEKAKELLLEKIEEQKSINDYWSSEKELQKLLNEELEENIIPLYKYHPFPAIKILAEGNKADGMAGAMATYPQKIAILPKGKVFCLRYFGRLYGAPNKHFLLWDGQKLHSLTEEERELTDLF